MTDPDQRPIDPGQRHRPRRRPPRPASTAPQAISLVVFVVAGDRQSAEYYPPPAVMIPVTGPLTIAVFVAELRSRPNVFGMRDLQVDPSVPSEQLLARAADLFRLICPFLSPQGTRITIPYSHATVTSAQIRAPLARICPRVIFCNQDAIPGSAPR